ncbi:hypothetical protein JCM10908_000529 [Rhodotorula pacifica]|uniref:uncharacterized protein n=1 Tax=Rhodotorula pacifica TaxID=1495444 RepID=UPI0031718719
MQRHSERVQRFESLLRPFAATPPEQPDADYSSDANQTGHKVSTAQAFQAVHDIGELPPGYARGPRSAEAWRREELRKLCGEGIPDDPKHLRAAGYRFLLNLDEPDVLVEQYRAFLADVNSQLAALPPPAGPLQQLQKEDKLLKEIQQDVERTFGALAWFSAEEEEQEGDDALWRRLDSLRGVQENGHTGVESGEEQPTEPSTPTQASHSSSPPPPSTRKRRTRRQILLRPLYLYASLNPGVSFVQGMSYIAAVLFYIFAQPPPPSPGRTGETDPSKATRSLEAEASTFFALSALLSQLRDLFVPALDGVAANDGNLHASTSVTGIGSALGRFRALLLVIDSTAADALDRKGVDLSGYVVRWLTTLFANEFPLPDVMRVWDRLLSFYPIASEQQTAEALSPVLVHLIDLALAVVESERSTVISPFAKAPKILSTLQDLQIEGEGIDRLLSSAWDIRERRLGRSKRQSVVSTPTKSGTGLGRMFGWSPSSAKAMPSSASDFDIDERSSIAGSDASKPSGHRFGSLAFSSPRSSQADLADNVTVIDGKVLPPPPARVDQHVTIASLIEEELRETEQLASATTEPDYSVEDDEDGTNEGPALHRRMASGWGGLKASFSRLAASDTAAELSKRATNLQIAAVQSASSASSRLQSSDAAAALARAQTNAAIKAQLLREQLAEQAPERLARLKEAAAGATGRLVASTDSDRSGLQQPGSPREAPFVPPTMAGDRDVPPLGSPRSDSASADMARTASGGPKPLLLSGSARRAQNSSEDYGSDRGGSVSYARSPSASPTLTRSDKLLSPDVAVPPLSRSPSRGGGSSHGRSASNWDTPTRTTASTFRPRSSSTAQSPATSVLEDQDSPIVSRRLQDNASALRRGAPTSRLREDESPSPAVVRTVGGRPAYQLTDAPVSGALELPPLDLGFDPSTFSQSFETPSVAAVSRPLLDDGLEAELPFVPPSGPSEVVKPSTRPARGSSLSGSNGPPQPAGADEQETAPIPPRISSLSSGQADEASAGHPPSGGGEDASLVANPSLSRSKVVRRPVGSRKRPDRSSTSMSGASGASLDMTGAEARRVASEFLTRSASGSSSSTSGMQRRRASEALTGSGDGPTRVESQGAYDEEEILDAYGQ